MKFNDHSNLKGAHAFLSPSSYHWINYSEDKLALRYKNQQAIAIGTKQHEFARQAIELGVKIRGNAQTLAQYVNDAIGYRMIPEQVLFYSFNCFGTADTILFRNNLLRIHDLKTGETPASMNQLKVYAALFCLEYSVKPGAIDIELRIYKDDDKVIERPEVDEIAHVMDRIVTFDKIIESLKTEE